MSLRYQQDNEMLDKAYDDHRKKLQELCTHLHGTFEIVPGLVQCKGCSKPLRHRNRK